MWESIRREVAALTWDTGPASNNQDLLHEWTATLQALLRLRRTLGRTTNHDPLALVSTATAGAVRASDGDPARGPDMARLRGALRGELHVADGLSLKQRQQHSRVLTHLTYQLIHGVRVHSDHPDVQRWLWAAESALDAAVHFPRPASTAAGFLADWQEALVVVQSDPRDPMLRHGVAIAHLTILKATDQLLAQAAPTDALPQEFLQPLRGAIRQLAQAHGTTIEQLGHPERSAAHEPALLKLGRSARGLTPPVTPQDQPAYLDALLRSNLGQASVVAHLVDGPDPMRAAARIQHLTTQYVARPDLLNEQAWYATQPRRGGQPVSPGPAPAIRPSQGVDSGHPRGHRLERSQVETLCLSRDLGRAAATADPTQPPEALRGIPPAAWPELIDTGERAVADLVHAVYPMAFAMTRKLPPQTAEDLRSDMFLGLTEAAHLYRPDLDHSASWSTYAWRVLENTRNRQLDSAGIRRRSHSSPLSLDALQEANRMLVAGGADPADAVISAATLEQIAAAIKRLPAPIRAPLQGSLQGQSAHQIADASQSSPETVYRRLRAARETLAPELLEPPTKQTSARMPLWETVTKAPRTPPSPAPSLGVPWETARRSPQPTPPSVPYRAVGTSRIAPLR